MSGSDAGLARVVASALDAVAEVLRQCADGRPGAGPDLDALIAARHAHRTRLTEATRAAVAADAPAAAVVGAIGAIFPLRVLSFVALSMATDAVVLTGGTARVVEDDFGVAEPTAAQGTMRRIAIALSPHVALRSVWSRNSLRAGIALALAVLVAKVGDIGHAFWVVLATLTVLRSNVATTRSTVRDAIVGTFAGFLLASAVMLTAGESPPALWATLVRAPVAMRTVADGVAVLERAGYCAGGSPLAGQRMQDAVGVVCASLDELADRLRDARHPPDPGLAAAVADLDLADSAGVRREEIAAAIAAWLEAHRDEPAAVVSAMGLSWASAWIGYLAHLGGLAGRALAEVDAKRG